MNIESMEQLNEMLTELTLAREADSIEMSLLANRDQERSLLMAELVEKIRCQLVSRKPCKIIKFIPQ